MFVFHAGAPTLSIIQRFLAEHSFLVAPAQLSATCVVVRSEFELNRRNFTLFFNLILVTVIGGRPKPG